MGMKGLGTGDGRGGQDKANRSFGATSTLKLCFSEGFGDYTFGVTRVSWRQSSVTHPTYRDPASACTILFFLTVKNGAFAAIMAA